MNRSLLFDSGCSLCSGLARDVVAASDGLLQARSLHDPELQAALKRARPEWRWEPTLLEVQGAEAHVFTGFALRAQLLTVLGPRRAWRVAQLVARAQTPLGDVDASRRALVKRGAALAAGVVGLALLGPAGSRAQSDGDAVSTASLRRPGRYSRMEGVRSWRVKRQGSNFDVKFEHKDRQLSGSVQVSVGGDGRARTMILSRRGERWQMALSGNGFAANDNRGQSATGRLVGRGPNLRWDISRQSDQVLRGSKAEFRLALVISADLAPVRRPRARSSGGAIAQQEQPQEVPLCTAVPDTCAREKVVGSAYGQIEAEARIEATWLMHDECRGAAGRPCCCREECWCPCVTSIVDRLVNLNLLCGCDCWGQPFP